MSEFSSEELTHLANLARIPLNAEDTIILRRDLPKIVDFVDQLTQAKAPQASITTGAALAELRQDEVQKRGLTVEELKSLAPKWRDGQIEVPAVFGEINAD